MSATEAAAQATCAEHPDRPSVGRCGRCGRTVCVECAVPFRGGIRCEACTALELGDPPPAAKPRPRGGVQRVALVLLLVSLVATIPPWHRSGTLTSAFSAWLPSPDPWSLVAGVAVLLATCLCALAVARRRTTPRWTLTWAALAILAAVTVGVDVFSAPRFFTVTAAPMVMAVSAAAAGVIGLAGARRLRA